MNAKQSVSERDQVDSERREFERAFDQDAIDEQVGEPTPTRVSATELAVGAVMLLAWFGLFAGGILVATGSYREEISASGGLEVAGWRNWAIVLAFWTITNIGILSCLSAWLGALGQRTRFTAHTDLAADDAAGKAHLSSSTTMVFYASAIMRGFGVYALVLAGLLVFAAKSLIEPEQNDYVRLAATVSIISFYAGYDPSIFAGLLRRVQSFLEGK